MPKFKPDEIETYECSWFKPVQCDTCPNQAKYHRLGDNPIALCHSCSLTSDAPLGKFEENEDKLF